MSAATASREGRHSDGLLKSYPVAGSTVIYKETLVCVNANGYLVPLSDTAGLTFAGVAYEKVNNASGADGALSCRVQKEGEFEFVYAGGDAAQLLVDEVVYGQDDQTVDEDVSLKVQTIPVGRLAEVLSATRVRVNIAGFPGPLPGLIRKYPQRRVTAKTADYTVLASESGQVFTTVGAAGTVVFSLPAAVVGLEYFFRVGAAQELRIDPNGTEKISLPSTGVPGAAGKYLSADASGESVHLLCTKDGEWTVMGYTGTWTAEA